ncbi:hypothetical protein NL676_026492 [Syzygium grande]|nr:hypothetical protein NL676_026492 [Syzygium grande]
MAMAAVKLVNMAVVAFFILALTALVVTVKALAPSPTSPASSVFPSILSTGVATVTALVFSSEAMPSFGVIHQIDTTNGRDSKRDYDDCYVDGFLLHVVLHVGALDEVLRSATGEEADEGFWLLERSGDFFLDSVVVLIFPELLPWAFLGGDWVKGVELN